jgi:hypothetical protein
MLFVFLLPVFFVLHGFTDYYDLVPLKPALRLTCLYLLAAGLFLFIYRFLFKNVIKAGLMAFITLCYYFFFGSVQDLLNRYFHQSFLVKYSFLLPVSLAMLLVVFFFLKRSQRQFKRATLYLNTLMLVLVLADAGLLVLKVAGKRSEEIIPAEKLLRCDTCSTPDIYFIIADAYPGKLQFKKILDYDNSRFEAALMQRGFYIADSSLSNYNFTFFSLGSMLNMNYFKHVSGSIRNKKNIPAGSKALKENLVLGFLKKQGYTFFNCSIFDFRNTPTKAKPTFWINDTRPVTSQTFLSRLNRDLGYHLVTTFKLRPVHPYPVDQDLKNNEMLLAATIKAAKAAPASPKFVYTHLIMPHHPYYFDSTGAPTPLHKLTKEYAFDRKAAISYIIYSNKKFLQLIDTILAHSARPPVILLISDHGFREIKEEKDKKTMFLNLNAVFFPDRNYSGFYTGISNVNLFRLLFNQYFGQQLPLLKDSTVFLTD